MQFTAAIYRSSEAKSTRTSSDSLNFVSSDAAEAHEGIVCVTNRLQNLFGVLISCTSRNSCIMAAADSPNFDLVRILFDDQHNVVSGKMLLSNYLIDRKDLEIGESVGAGSSGEVYKGFYKGQKVAVKKLKGMTRGSRTEGEFRREVLGLISCAHKNVLKLYGVCLDSEHGVCIVTKFMEGGSLLQFLQQKQGLKMKDILRLAKDVAKGMEFLHSRGVVHMDLKTANVFLDKEGRAVIGDLGVARLGTEKVEVGETIGTYRWMAPEVCGAESGDTGSFSPKSDVYSFAILLWELITCQTPYADYNPVQAAVGVVMHGLRPAIPPNCFPPLRYLIEKCWDQNPSVRPSFSQISQMLQIISKEDWS